MIRNEWFVFYTKSRQEKKVNELLKRSGFEVFLPVHKILRQWSDRKKKVEVPLFPAYIFVKVSEDKIIEVLQTPGIAWNVKLDKKPAILHAHEFTLINRFLESGHTIETSVSSADFNRGDDVEVVDGAFKGFKGKVMMANDSQRFVVNIESIGQNLSIAIDSAILKKI